MRFLGTHSHTMDTKGRLSIPVEFRVEIQLRSENASILTNDKNCLALYPYDDWEAFSDRLARVSQIRPEVRKFQRFFVAGAAKAPFDSQGRILIPQHLRQHAQLGREVIVAGVGPRIELWNKELFATDRADTYENIDEISSLVADHDR
ncbi:MAG: division/cell wall cluster transcriptional repressor MraZ [Myxococcota bacterium]